MAVAVLLINKGKDSIALEELDRRLNWGAGQLNPAVAFLNLND